MKRFRQNIQKVACSVTLCSTRKSEEKLLGGSVPDFYFHLLSLEDETKRPDVFLRKSQVDEIFDNYILDEEERQFCCCRKRLELKERDKADAVRFLKDTGGRPQLINNLQISFGRYKNL